VLWALLIPKPTATYTGGRYSLGLFVPANTPRAVVDQLYRETEKALRTPGVMDKFKPQGIEPMPMTSAEFDALIKREIEINIALVKAANLKFN
jgi:tripartite-type tricarboxylate transporter receptor subunit TctC